MRAIRFWPEDILLTKFKAALAQELEERAERDEVIVLRPALHGFRTGSRLAVEPQAELADVRFRDILDVLDLHLLEVPREVPVVVLDGLHGPAALDLEFALHRAFGLKLGTGGGFQDIFPGGQRGERLAAYARAHDLTAVPQSPGGVGRV